MKKKKNKPQARGFTLTELMVVIVIVTVLATLASVVGNQVKERATLATCSNNLRQIGLGLAAHQADFNRFPGKNEGIAWDRKILPYLGYDGDRNLQGNGPLNSKRWPDLEKAAAYFACDSDRYERSDNAYKRSYAIVSWTTNWSNGTAFRGWKNRPFNKGIPMSGVPDPSMAATVVEWHSGTESAVENAVGSGGHAYHGCGGPNGEDRDVHKRNQIVLFADGHTQVLPFTTIENFVERYWPGVFGTVD